MTPESVPELCCSSTVKREAAPREKCQDYTTSPDIWMWIIQKSRAPRIIKTARPTAGRTEAIKRFASHRSSIPFAHSPLHFRVVVAPLVWLCQIHVFPLPPKSCRKRSRNGRSASPATLICPAKRLCVSRGSAFHGKFPETSQEPSLRKMPDRAPYTTVDKERL